MFWPGADGKTYVAPVQADGTAGPPAVAFGSTTTPINAVGSPDGLHLILSGFFPGIQPGTNSGTFAISAPPAGTPWDGGRLVLSPVGPALRGPVRRTACR